MKISQQNLNELMKDEGCVLKAYKDTGGVLTIGFGHTLGVKPTDVITKEKAYELLAQDMAAVERWINLQGLNINQNQFDALCSLVYNCGPGNVLKWGIIRMIKANPNNKEIGDEIMKHVYDRKGNKLPGLIKRRSKEIQLYYKQV